jgi:hypothetical protein
MKVESCEENETGTLKDDAKVITPPPRGDNQESMGWQ